MYEIEHFHRNDGLNVETRRTISLRSVRQRQIIMDTIELSCRVVFDQELQNAGVRNIVRYRMGEWNA